MGGLSRKIGIAMVAAAGVVATLTGANAADMSLGAAAPLPSIAQPDEGPVSFGTGWYLRGDLGVSQDLQVGVGGITLPTKPGYPNGWSVSLGGGYKFNDWVRADMTFDWRAPRSYAGNTRTAACITSFTAVTNQVTLITTYVPNYDTCNNWVQARITNFTTLVNLYADLGTWGGFTPYVGAGAGVNLVYQKIAESWFMSNGNPYQVYASAGPTNYYFNWNQARSVTTTQFAWALMAGASYALTPNVAVDVGARYLNLGKIDSISNFTGVTSSRSNTAKELRVGFRYTPDL